MTLNNSILVIAPYRYNGTWVFDDENVGLVREPFVEGVPQIIDYLVCDTSNADSGFRMTFSDTAFPSYTHSIEWVREESGGNWYHLTGDVEMDGWLCPALFQYFPTAPAVLYLRAEGIGA